jgi:hypothetical protein
MLDLQDGNNVLIITENATIDFRPMDFAWSCS